MATTSTTNIKSGLGVPTYPQIQQNPSLISTVQEAANKGDYIAQLRLAKCYQYGTGVQKDEIAANFWNKKADAICKEPLSDIARNMYCNVGPYGAQYGGPAGSPDVSDDDDEDSGLPPKEKL